MQNLRIKHLNTSDNIESWIAMYNNELIGYIYMIREDDFKLRFIEAWVDDDHQGQGILWELLEARWEHVCIKYMGWKIYAS